MNLTSIATIAAITAVSIAKMMISSATPARGQDDRHLLPSWGSPALLHNLPPNLPDTANNAIRREISDLTGLPIQTRTFEFDDPFIQIENPWPEDIVTNRFTYTLSAESATTFTSGTSAPSPTNVPNIFSDLLWEDAASHGCRLFDAMRDSEYAAGQLYSPQRVSVQSIHMNFEKDFQGWGWATNEIVGENTTVVDGGKVKPDPGWGIGGVLRSLGLSDKTVSQGGKIRIIHTSHGQAPFTSSYTKDGESYPHTGAHFKVGVNIEEGVLMAIDRISPVSAGERRNPPVPTDRLPVISTFSDIGFLTYQHVLGKVPSEFTYMMSVSITNEKTKSIIARAMNSRGRVLGRWPGETFSWRSKEFKALLGSPNGMGFGYLLAQHKAQVGNLVIDQIQVFTGETWHGLPNILFHVKKFDGMSPPNKGPGEPPKMEETLAPSKRRREVAPMETRVYIQDAKHIVRGHVLHAEL